ncbi:MAG: secretin N-terminal domain-containing protein, partial [Alphaproteobacteria bacterium]
MKNNDNHNNPIIDGKASNNRSRFFEFWTGFHLPSGRFFRWSAVMAVLLLTIVLWAIAQTGQAEEKNADKPVKTESKQTTGKQDQDKQFQGRDSDNTDMKPVPRQNAEENELYQLFNQYAEAFDKDPNSPRTQALSKKLDETMEKLQEKMEKDPLATLEKLPAAPSAPKPTISPGDRVPRPRPKTAPLLRKAPRPSARITQTKGLASQSGQSPAPQVSQREGPSPREVNEPNVPSEPPKAVPAPAAEQAKPKTADETPAKPVEAKAPAAAARPNEAAAEVKPASPLEIEKEDDYVKIKTQDDVIDINMLLETIGKELKLNFIYPDGVVPTGKVKLQQYGKIHRRELLPLLESVLAFSGYSMVREDPYIRIVKRAEVLKKTEIFTPFPYSPPTDAEESVVVRIVELQHANFNDVKKVLTDFVPDPSVITTIQNTNYLIITDYDRRISRLLDIIALVDKPGPMRRLEILQPQYLLAKQVQGQIDSLLNALNAQSATIAAPTPPAPKPAPRGVRRPSKPKQPTKPTATSKISKPTFLVDDRTNRLFVIGTDEQIEQVEHLLSLFDVPQPGPEIKLVPVTVEYVTASEVMGQISKLIQVLNEETTITPRAPSPPMPATKGKRTPPAPARPRKTVTPPAGSGPKGPYMQPDERTNRILIVGTEDQIAQVQDLLGLLDVPVGEEIKLEPLEVENVLASEVMGQINDLIKALNEQTQPKPSTTTQPVKTAKPPARPTSKGTAKTPTSTTSLAGPKGPYMLADERTNRILVVG